MKKLIMTIALVAVAATSAMAQINIGAGYLNSTATSKTSNTSTDTNLQGLYAGAGYQVNLGNGLTVTPGVYYSFLTGENVLWDNSITSAKGTEVEQYITVPVQIGYGINLTPDFRIYVYGAPSFNYGLTSTVKYDASVLGISASTDEIDLYGDDYNYSKMDVLVGGGAGIDFKNCLRITGGYNYGLLDRNTSDDVTSHRSEWHVGVAVIF